jgi:hypothetical protein
MRRIALLGLACLAAYYAPGMGPHFGVALGSAHVGFHVSTVAIVVLAFYVAGGLSKR